jgi:hypothetical protein
MRSSFVRVAFLAAISALSYGQNYSIPGGVPVVISLPATCTPSVAPAVVFLSLDGVTGALYTCTGVNIWSLTNGANGTNGTNGAPGAPGFSPNTLTSGGSVVWVSGYTYSVSAATYTIGGASYSSALTSLTLTAADPSLNRIDTIAVNTSGAAVVVTGTAATNPVTPTLDPSSQLALAYVSVPAGSSQPSNVTTTLVYDEDSGPSSEWTATSTGSTVALASTNNPYHLTHDIEVTSSSNAVLTFTIGSGSISPGGYNNLVLYVRSKGAWSKRSLTLSLLNSSSVQQGSTVSLSDGQFGFSSSTTSAYQQIVIPVNLFGALGLTVTKLRMAVAGSGSGIGFYLDFVQLQAGVNSGSAPSSLQNCGTWSASASYPINCQVSYNGISYVALVANAGSTPSASNANWFQQDSDPRSFGCTFSGSGSALTNGTTAGTSLCYLPPLPMACTTTGWTVTVDTGTAGFRVWRIAAGTAVPTVANTITTADLAIATGTNLSSTTFANFSGGTAPVFALGDLVAVQLNAVSSATYATFSILCAR